MVEILRSGMFDSIQDLGRFGYQQFGVPVSGAMDRAAAKMANAILGNHGNDAVLECVISGPKLKFHNDTQVCICGADMSVTRNGKPVKNNVLLTIKSQDELNFGRLVRGCRAYLAVKDGFKTQVVMSSRSMYAHVTTKNRLEKGDRLSYEMLSIQGTDGFSSIKVDASYFETQELEVFEGPEFDRLTKGEREALFSKKLTIANSSNRMAYQFNELIENRLEGVLTSLVLPGTVQLTPSGQLIVLMRDAQTTGGYPRILQLTEASIDRLSQKIFGAKIQLKCIKS